MPSIFDFDQTISVQHTFNQFQLKPPLQWKSDDDSLMYPGFIYIDIRDEAHLNWMVVTEEGERLQGYIPYETALLVERGMIPIEQRMAIRESLLNGFDNPVKKALLLSFYPPYYHKGKELASNNMRSNLSNYFQHDDEESLSAVATFHNNHSLVAGYIASLMKKELVFQETLLSEEPVTAIAIYRIEGISKPFLISYIPDIERVFMYKMSNQLKGLKNHQLQHLYQTFLTREFITPETIIDFYDDSETNFRGAASVPNINCHWVDKEGVDFVVKETIWTEPAQGFYEGHAFRC